MAFIPVSTTSDSSSGGNFPTNMRTFYNTCGEDHYHGAVTLKDAKHLARKIPIFHEDCLEPKKETRRLVTVTRQAMRGARGRGLASVLPGSRSIHQNADGYLPYQPEAKPVRGAVVTRPESASMQSDPMFQLARSHGKLPSSQTAKGAKTRGDFIEITCGDDMLDAGRLVVDYRFGIVYITFGHYHPESFALLIRSTVELDYEIKPVLRSVSAQFEA